MNSIEHTYNLLLSEEFENEGIPEIVEANYGKSINFYSPKIFSRSAPQINPNRVKLTKYHLHFIATSKIIFDFKNDEVVIK